MKKSLCVLFFIPVVAVGSEVGGVRDSSFEAGVGGTSGDSSSSLSADGSFTFGLGDYFASRISADIGRTFGEGSALDSDSVGAGLSVSARRFDIGKLGVGYSRDHTRFDLPWGNESVDLNGYSAFGQYYLGSFTLGISRQLYAFEGDRGSDFHLWGISVGGYLSENTRLVASGAGMDAADQYVVSIEHQPAWFGSNASIGVGYFRSPDNESISLEINYFFGNKVSLKVRDREFR